MSEENTHKLPENGAVKPVLPEAASVLPQAPVIPEAKPVLPKAPVLPAANASVNEVKHELPKASVLSFSNDDDTSAPKPAASSFALPKAKSKVSFAPGAASIPVVKTKNDEPSMFSVVIDFVAAAVAVAFAVMTVIDK